jgi:hypothetical protein
MIDFGFWILDGGLRATQQRHDSLSLGRRRSSDCGGRPRERAGVRVRSAIQNPKSKIQNQGRRGTVAVAMIIVMTVISLVIVGMVLGGARDQDLTIRRLETLGAFYAAEAGMNMALRESMLSVDEDGDGGVGSISDDANAGNDPVIGSARVRVEVVDGADESTLISHGRAGDSQRRIESDLEGGFGQAMGLKARYYTSASTVNTLDGIDWNATPTYTGSVANLNFASTNGQGWPGGPTNNWGRRYTGVIAIPTAGTWTFTTNSDDGSKLWIDGTLVVNNDGTHSMSSVSASIALTAGDHLIEVRWFERTGVYGLIVSWAGPGVSTQVIPVSALRH